MIEKINKNVLTQAVVIIFQNSSEQDLIFVCEEIEKALGYCADYIYEEK